MGFVLRLKSLPKFLRGDKAGTDQLALAPSQQAHPKNLTSCGECEAKQFRHRQRADIETGAAVGHIDDGTLDPWRIRRRDQKSRLVQIDPDMLARPRSLRSLAMFPLDGEKLGENT